MYYFLKLCSFTVILLGMSAFKNPDAEWKEYFQNDQVTIEFTAQSCGNSQAGTANNYVFLRIKNKTNQNLEVSFSRELWYNDVCSNCQGGDEAKTSIVLNANETAEGTCESVTKDLKIFQSSVGGSKKTLTKFDLKNLTVTTLK